MENLKTKQHTENPSQDVKRLCAAVEHTIGRRLTNPTDFSMLAVEIARRSDNQDNISLSTLKRVWGYVKSDHAPSESILSVLARFCGFRDWTHFLNSNTPDSGFLVVNPISAAALAQGATLEIAWAPERVVTLCSLGNGDFIVVSNLNSKLREGDVLTLTVVCRGYPLYATNVRRGTAVIPAYVAAKENGILSVTITPSAPGRAPSQPSSQ